jgi:hypothetical protein
MAASWLDRRQPVTGIDALQLVQISGDQGGISFIGRGWPGHADLRVVDSSGAPLVS